jgi:tRNA(Arg) A34 adenosine deaminase TadA
MCLAAIYWARLERIYYAATRQDAAAIGFDDSRIYKEVALGIDRRAIPMEQALHEEGYAAFHAWLQKADRTPY